MATTQTSVNRERSLAYMPQLDALRAFAVTAVIVHHFIPGGWAYGAAAGVRLFFTLSGFLITGILLRSKDAVEGGKQTRRSALGKFYARRFLRIFPLYYFVVACAFALNLEPVREIIGWLLTYTLNIRMARQGWWEEHFAHFWSLCVEEQFYIFWPWLIVLLPRRWLKPVVLLVILAGPAYRLSFVLSGYMNMRGIATYISTITCLDSLGLGALLALLLSTRRAAFSGKSILAAAIVFAAALALSLRYTDATIILHDTAQAGLFACIIAATAPGVGGFLGAVLRWPPLRYIGKISYGIYVYHPFMPEFVESAFHKMGMTVPERSLGNAAVSMLVTLVCASLSWRLLERPINELKRYF